MLAWDEILGLHVIRKISALIHRRWAIGVGFVRSDGSIVEVPEARFGRLGHAGCTHGTNAGEAVLAALRNGSSATRQVVCPQGLRDIAVAVKQRGRLEGAVLAGAFHAAADGAAGPSPHVADHEIGFLEELLEALAGEIVQWSHERDVARERIVDLERELASRSSHGGLIGKSRPMQDLYRLLDKVSSTDATVLITGENGTGKELVARAIHQNSPRANHRFVATNCSSFNDNLLDSELFGHKRGSFTGAVSEKLGLFAVADKGTFFLDEIGDMSPSLQVKLLRVLQEGTFLPVGGVEPVEVDVRILAATNRDLKAMVARGDFREDLYYRVHVIMLRVPPLRERREDLPMLVEHFLGRHARGGATRKGLSAGCLERLLDYEWPGNVRELENEIERLWVLSGETEVIPEDLLSPRVREGRSSTTRASAPDAAETAAALAGTSTTLPDALAVLERSMIADRLRRAHGNKSQAARDLGISRRNLIRKVKEYGLDRPTEPERGQGKR